MRLCFGLFFDIVKPLVASNLPIVTLSPWKRDFYTAQ